MVGPAVAQGRGLRWKLRSKTAQSRMREAAGPMAKVRFVGLDVHKESIAIAVADADGSGERQSRCRLKVHAGSDSAWCRRGAFEVLAAIAGTMLVVGGAPMRSPSAARALV
jgi:hypothetical protein